MLSPQFKKGLSELLEARERTVKYITEDLGLDANDYDDFHQRLFAINKHVPQYTFVPGVDADPNDENVARALELLPDFCSNEMSQIIINRLLARGITGIQRRRIDGLSFDESKEKGAGADSDSESLNEGAHITDDYPFDATSTMSEIYNFAIYNSYRIRLRRDSVLNNPKIIEYLRAPFDNWSIDFVSLDDVDERIRMLCDEIYNSTGIRAVQDDFVALSNAPMNAVVGEGLSPETEAVRGNQ